jgi:hypothetical protein
MPCGRMHYNLFPRRQVANIFILKNEDLTATRESLDCNDFKCYKYVQCYHTNLYNNHEKCCIYIWVEADFIIYSLTLVPDLNVVHCKLPNFFPINKIHCDERMEHSTIKSGESKLHHKHYHI